MQMQGAHCHWHTGTAYISAKHLSVSQDAPVYYCTMTLSTSQIFGTGPPYDTDRLLPDWYMITPMTGLWIVIIRFSLVPNLRYSIRERGALELEENYSPLPPQKAHSRASSPGLHSSPPWVAKIMTGINGQDSLRRSPSHRELPS